MYPHLAPLAVAAQHWGPHAWNHSGGGPGWWLIFPIGFLLFLFGALGVAALYVVRRTRPQQTQQQPQPPADASA